MSEITYNTKLIFKDTHDENHWRRLLAEYNKAFDLGSKMIFDAKPKLSLKEVHSLLYFTLREKYPFLPSQFIIRIEKDLIACYRSIRSNKYKIDKPITKKNSAIRLDKRLYSRFSKKGISLISSTAHKRCNPTFVLYDKIEKLFDNYPIKDPLIFIKDNEIYLSVTFSVLDKPLNEEKPLGIDLGCRRLFTTSDGLALKGNEFSHHKRKIRYLKRQLQSKGSKSAKRKLKKVRRKERNFSKNYIHNVSKKILETDKTVIVLEDLTKIKERTKKTEEGFKRTKHNNRLSQVPFYMLKQFLTYKAQILGKRIVTVSPAYTSRLNSITGRFYGERKGCRFYASKKLIFDADYNASINIAKRSKLPVSFSVPFDGTLNFIGRLLVNQPNVSNQ